MALLKHILVFRIDFWLFFAVLTPMTGICGAPPGEFGPIELEPRQHRGSLLTKIYQIFAWLQNHNSCTSNRYIFWNKILLVIWSFRIEMFEIFPQAWSTKTKIENIAVSLFLNGEISIFKISMWKYQNNLVNPAEHLFQGFPICLCLYHLVDQTSQLVDQTCLLFAFWELLVFLLSTWHIYVCCPIGKLSFLSDSLPVAVAPSGVVFSHHWLGLHHHKWG